MSNLAPETDDAQNAAAQRREARLRATQTLTRIGLKFAQALEQDLDALSDAPVVAAPGDTASQAKRELGRAYAQVSRAVSLAVTLEDRLDQDPEIRRLEAEARAARAKAEAARAQDIRAESALPRRKREVEATLSRAVSDAAAYGTPRHYDLSRALSDTLDRELMNLDRFLDGPVDETIARIAKGLGLEVERDTDEPPEAESAKAEPQRGAPFKSAHPRERGDPGFFVHEPDERARPPPP